MSHTRSSLVSLVALAALLQPSCKAPGPEVVTPVVAKQRFGKTADGEEVDIYTIVNRGGTKAKVMTYGALLTEFHVADRDGTLGDVVLGFDNLQAYLDGHPYFGCTTGRVANRIAGGKFTLNGVEYQLATNNDPNHLHGGVKGIDKRVWKAEPFSGETERGVKFSYTSPDGEEGYPGNLTIHVVYTLTDSDELRLDYAAETDRATPINLTNHTYFNLHGGGEGTILEHELTVLASRFTPVDDTLIPTGEIVPVAGTVMDFMKPTPIGTRIDRVGGDPTGYDHNYVLDHEAGRLGLAVVLHDPQSGRTVECLTTEPGVQIYTGNFLDGTLTGKYGRTYPKHAAMCMETQHFPDSVNHPNFPSTILEPGKPYKSTTIYRFSAK